MVNKKGILGLCSVCKGFGDFEYLQATRSSMDLLQLCVYQTNTYQCLSLHREQISLCLCEPICLWLLNLCLC